MILAVVEGPNPLLPPATAWIAFGVSAVALALLVWAVLTLVRARSLAPAARAVWFVIAVFVPVLGPVLTLLALRSARRRALLTVHGSTPRPA